MIDDLEEYLETLKRRNNKLEENVMQLNHKIKKSEIE